MIPEAQFSDAARSRSNSASRISLRSASAAQFSDASRSRSASASSGVTHRSNTTPHVQATIRR